MTDVTWLEKFFETDYFKDQEKLYFLKKISETLNEDSKFINEYYSRLINLKIKPEHIFPNSKFKVLQLGIPTSIKSGVVNVMLNLNKALMKKGVGLAVINHWWHKYNFF